MKRKTIRSHEDFDAPIDAPTVTNSYFVVKVKVAARNDARYGIVAAKHTFRLAVQRNRAKRVLRDWIAYNEHLMLPDADYIFIAREPILRCSREAGRVKMGIALKKISK